MSVKLNLRDKIKVVVTKKYAELTAGSGVRAKEGDIIEVNPTLVDRMISNGTIKEPSNWKPLFSSSQLANVISPDVVSDDIKVSAKK